MPYFVNPCGPKANPINSLSLPYVGIGRFNGRVIWLPRYIVHKKSNRKP